MSNMSTDKKTIKAGQKLTCRSIGDYDCVFEALIFDRKGNFVTVKFQGIESRRKVNTDEHGNEFVYATPKYSMCPVFRA